MITSTKDVYADAIKLLTLYCHSQAVATGWWNDPHTGEDIHGKRNVPELLCLCHSELSEAMEGYRKDSMDEHLPERKMFEVELADLLIRVFDIAGSMNLDLGGAFVEKMEYNLHRADHKHENRKKEGGKKF